MVGMVSEPERRLACSGLRVVGWGALAMPVEHGLLQADGWRQRVGIRAMEVRPSLTLRVASACSRTALLSRRESVAGLVSGVAPT